MKILLRRSHCNSRDEKCLIDHVSCFLSPVNKQYAFRLHRGSRVFSRWFSRHIRICREEIFHDIYVFTTYTTFSRHIHTFSRHIPTIIRSRHILTTYKIFTIQFHDIFSRWKTSTTYSTAYIFTRHCRRKFPRHIKIPHFDVVNRHRGVLSWLYVVSICRENLCICREYFTYMSWKSPVYVVKNNYRGYMSWKLPVYVVKIPIVGICRDKSRICRENHLSWLYIVKNDMSWYCIVIFYRDIVSWYCIVILHRDTASWYIIVKLYRDNVSWYFIVIFYRDNLSWPSIVKIYRG